MHIHILGICGTFMGGIALLARKMGYKVTGSDLNVYPPMSTQLEEQGIELITGFDPKQLESKADLVVIGNSMSRGNPCVEAVLNQGLDYISGPEFLAKYVLKGKHIIAVSGTHGKTSTASMLAWILEYSGKKPGFLIGGIPQNFKVSASIGESNYFVVEADEYDSAFFDKRSKFIHYRPKTLVINNLEYDHADIFPDLLAIQLQFHHLVRTIPSNGLIIWPKSNAKIQEVIDKGCWSRQTLFDNEGNIDWNYKLITPSGEQFELFFNDNFIGKINWSLIGNHNIENAIMAIAAATDIGIEPSQAIEALISFIPPKRRLEQIANINNISIYDDFAHHPTAIAKTLEGVKSKFPNDRIIAVLEPRSNTMKLGIHKDTLPQSISCAEIAYIYKDPSIDWDLDKAMQKATIPTEIHDSIDTLVEKLLIELQPNDQVIIMSNGGFSGFHLKLIKALKETYE